jgi:hypothetical protein
MANTMQNIEKLIQIATIEQLYNMLEKLKQSNEEFNNSKCNCVTPDRDSFTSQQFSKDIGTNTDDNCNSKKCEAQIYDLKLLVLKLSEQFSELYRENAELKTIVKTMYEELNVLKSCLNSNKVPDKHLTKVKSEIDSNKELDMPYREMSAFLQKTTKTKIELLFQDALTVDYASLDYDMVFTSPPYYNIEVYSGMKEKTKEEWNTGFYKPLFERTWKHMRSPGYYCLNIPSEVYDSACVPILGKSWKKILLKKRGRTQKNEEEGKGYEEYIYVWKK